MINKEKMKENQNLISLSMLTLKSVLVDTKMCIAFDKEENTFIFFDREHYLETEKFSGFSIPISDLAH